MPYVDNVSGSGSSAKARALQFQLAVPFGDGGGGVTGFNPQSQVLTLKPLEVVRNAHSYCFNSRSHWGAFLYFSVPFYIFFSPLLLYGFFVHIIVPAIQCV